MVFETFICSSDNTHDVFEPIFLKNSSVFHLWPNKIFVGCNKNTKNKPFSTIASPLLGGWRQELLHQLTELKKQTTADYVFLLLDDFYFFETISYEVIKKHVSYASDNKLDYLRLVKLRRSFIASILLYFSTKRREYIQLKPTEPYYTSLQPAIWRIDYLLELLSMPCNIWEFEHLVYTNSKHSAVTKDFLSFSHLVEKGKWLPKALNIIDSRFHAAMRSRGIHRYSFFNKPIVSSIKFYIFGYLILKSRKYLFSK